MTRLDFCEYIAFYEGTDMEEEDDEQYQEAVDQLLAPFCGCTGCLAREAVHASYENVIKAFLEDLVGENQNADKAPCCIVGKRAWDYHCTLLDIASGDENPEQLAQKVLVLSKGTP